jgi:hypothetical protein
MHDCGARLSGRERCMMLRDAFDTFEIRAHGSHVQMASRAQFLLSRFLILSDGLFGQHRDYPPL